ncbi:WD40 repeat domain-containing protein [Streptomyces sp. NPDC015661]|uniref:WD40 repeat domain-containing protein n=1 Tax=Streptomyces sp. NPDC015661 TaxID=3364961 RepID=UPI0036F63FC1
MSEPESGETGLYAWAAGRSRIFQAARDQYVAERDLHVHYEDGLRRTRQALRGDEPGGGECPYPGLAAFDAEQARWFFGRDRLTAELLLRLDERLVTGGPLVVTAPSGAGKSSLLRAGLLPAVRRGALPVAGSADWPQVLITPTAQPLAALAAGLAEHTGLSTGELEGPGSAAETGRFVVVVDQLEELFTLGVGEREQHRFLDLLAGLAGTGLDRTGLAGTGLAGTGLDRTGLAGTGPAGTGPAGTGPGGSRPRAVVVYGLRSDFYGSCAGFPQLREALRQGQLLVGPMTRAELREAILFPARDVGLEVEPGLVELLLRDLGADADPGGSAGGRGTGTEDAGGVVGVSAVAAESGRGGDAGAAESGRGGDARAKGAGRGGDARAKGAGRGGDAGAAESGRGGDARAKGAGRGGDAGAKGAGRGGDAGAEEDGREGDAAAEDGGAYEVGRLPYLAHALRACWQQRHGHTLTVDGYRATGGIHQAIATTAERIFGALDPAEQQAARALFLRLVRIGDGTQDTRRRIARTELADLGDDPVALTATVDAFTRGRLLTQRQDTIEISHEALLRAWPRLRRWIDTDRTGLLIRQQLEQAAHEWADNRRDPGLLYRGLRLQTARDWANRPDHDRPSATASAFLSASGRNARRSVRIRRSVIAGLATLAVLTSATAIVALQQRSTAQEQQRVATSRQLMTQAESVFRTDPRTALRLGVAAHGLHADADTYGSLQEAISSTPYAGQLTGLASPVTSVVYSPGGRYLAAGFERGGIMLWDVSDPLRPRQLGEAIAIPNTVGVKTVGFSKGESRLVAAAADGAVAVWDLSDPRHPRLMGTPLRGVEDSDTRTWLSPDGTVLARSSEAAPGLELLDVTDPARIRPFGPPTAVTRERVQTVAFSSDGSWIAASGRHTWEGPVTLWDIRQRRAPRQLGRIEPAQRDLVDAVALSADGRTLALGGALFGAALWNVADPTHPKPSRAFTRVTAGAGVAFSPHGSTLATKGEGDAGLLLWDVTSIDAPRSTEQLTAGQTDSAKAFSPDGLRAASGSVDGIITLWNLARAGHPRAFGPPLAAHTGQHNRIDALAMSEDGTMLATGASDHTVVLWDITAPARPRRLATLPALTGHADEDVRAVAFAPDGRTLATGGRAPDDALGKATVVLWDLSDRKHPRRLGSPLTGAGLIVEGLVFSADARTLVARGGFGTTIWDVGDAARPRRRAEVLHDEITLGVWRVRDGRLLALVAGSGSPTVTRSPVPEPTISITYSDSDGVVILGDSTSTPSVGSGDPNGARLWDISEPAHPRRLGQALAGHAHEVAGGAMSPAGNLLATSDIGGAVILWDLKDPTHARRLGEPLGPYGNGRPSVQFAPSAGFMATGGDDGNVLLWDLGNPARPRQLSTALPTAGGITQMLLSSDGRILATAGMEGKVVLWDLRPTYDLRDSLDRTACLVAGGGLTREEWARYLPGTGYRNTCPG